MADIRFPFFIPAAVLLGLAGAFTVDDDGARWFWADRPWVAVVLLVVSAALWVLALVQRRARRTAAAPRG